MRYFIVSWRYENNGKSAQGIIALEQEHYPSLDALQLDIARDWKDVHDSYIISTKIIPQFIQELGISDYKSFIK